MIVALPVRPEISGVEILCYGLVAFLFGVLITPAFVTFLRRNKLGKQLRVAAVDGGEVTIFRKYHKEKHGTPTMGGLLIWGSILVTILVSRVLALAGVVDHSLLQRGEVYLPLFMLVSLGLLGGIDDYLNIIGVGAQKGLAWLPKVSTLLGISLIGALWFSLQLGYDSIHIPYVGDVHVGLWYIPIFMFVLVGTANAVNVTDGLDGLAGGLLVISYLAFGVLAYLQGFSTLAGFCVVTASAVAAFLWNNVPPALFFMGDTGSLALGGTLAVIALMTNQVLALPFIGFIFVVETASVIIQLTSKKFRGGKKVFLAAPIHHHFEALEWGESKVTMRFWIIGAFMAFLGILVGFFG